MDPEAKLKELGVILPEPPAPVAAYIPWTRTGNLVYVAGQVPLVEGRPALIGRVPDQVSIEQARKAARQCAINGLAIVKAAAGSLSRVERVVRVDGFVACGPEFTMHPKVVDGASELLVDVFGDKGKHARVSTGASSLPLGVPVEVAFVFEVR